jgi:hypothetical protein
MEKSRARRIRQTLRMKKRAEFWMRYIWRYNEDAITAGRIGRTAAMHGTHICSMCKWEKLNNIRPISEKRKTISDYL